MSLIGYIKSKDKKVNILEYENPRNEFEKGDIFCPLCNEPMIIKHGNLKIRHFAHKTKCTSDFDRHPESIEHIVAKHEVSKSIKEEWEEYSSCDIELEYPLPEVKRIIDIAMIFPTGWIVAHEIQLSSITTKELDERSKDYLNAGVDVIWWFGKSANTTTNRNWAIARYGSCFVLDYEKLQETASLHLL